MSATFSFRLDWTRPPLTENQRLHHMARAQIVRDTRLVGRLHGSTVARVVKGGERVEVLLEWVVADNRRRDEDNVVPTLKALCDGLVDAGVVPDDTPQWMTKQMPRIRVERGVKPHMILTVSVADANLD